MNQDSALNATDDQKHNSDIETKVQMQQSRTVTQEVHSEDEQDASKQKKNEKETSDDQYIQQSSSSNCKATIKNDNEKVSDLQSLKNDTATPRGTRCMSARKETSSSRLYFELSASKDDDRSAGSKIDQNSAHNQHGGSQGAGQQQRKKYIRKNVTCFDKELDSKLLTLVRELGETAWSRISKLLGKSEIKCHKRYLELSDRSHMANAPWSKAEDETLTAIVRRNGARDWTGIAMHLPGRIGKQCRERWHHHLAPDVVKRKWTLEEDLLIVRLHREHNARWSEMAKFVPGRTDNQIKNRYNSNLKKRFQDREFVEMVEREVPSGEGKSKSDVSQMGGCDESVDSVTFDAFDTIMPNASQTPTDLRAVPSQEILKHLRNQNNCNIIGGQIINHQKEAGVDNDNKIELVFTCKQRRISKYNFKRGEGLQKQQQFFLQSQFEQMNLGSSTPHTPTKSTRNVLASQPVHLQKHGLGSNSCSNRLDSAWATPQPVMKHPQQYHHHCHQPTQNSSYFATFDEMTTGNEQPNHRMALFNDQSSATLGTSTTAAHTFSKSNKIGTLPTSGMKRGIRNKNEMSSSGQSCSGHDHSMLNATMALTCTNGQQTQHKRQKLQEQQQVDPCFKLLDKLLNEGDQSMPEFKVLAISQSPNEREQVAYCIPVWCSGRRQSDKN